MKRHEPVWPVTELEAEVARLQQQLAEREKKKYEKRIAKLEAENERLREEIDAAYDAALREESNE